VLRGVHRSLATSARPMNSRTWDAPQPRKLPRQTRAANTIEIVLEAAVQLLIAEGPRELTTTRVAKRSGFAVGTLYQYFANKDELIDTLLHRHLELVVTRIERVCRANHSLYPGVMTHAVADAFVTANMERVRDLAALQLVWMRIEKSALFCDAFARLRDATASMLASAQLEAAWIDFLAFRIASILVGTMRTLLEHGMDEALLIDAHERIVSIHGAFADPGVHALKQSVESQQSSVDNVET
jgi:AcrR family transcriptional regulator